MAVTKTGVTRIDEKGLSLVFPEKFSHLSSKSESAEVEAMKERLCRVNDDEG